MTVPDELPCEQSLFDFPEDRRDCARRVTKYWKIYYSSPQPCGQPFWVHFLQASLCICWSVTHQVPVLLICPLALSRVHVAKTRKTQTSHLRPRGRGYSREFPWIGMCREGSWTLTLFKDSTDTLFRPKREKWHPIQGENKITNSMKRRTLFLFCNIRRMKDSHINSVAFSHSSIR